MRNVVAFQNKLTVNGRFMMDFMDAELPCFALGLVEERERPSGFLALRLDKAIHPARARCSRLSLRSGAAGGLRV